MIFPHQLQTDITRFKSYLPGYKIGEVGGMEMLVPQAGRLTCDLLFSRETISPEESSRRFTELGRISASAYANVGADLKKYYY